ncbi:MAG: calcineurin-like phosphoesterase family protein, partial [Myxococcaceae bacterium]|nr:calcineurin-like phosphoesterase family protein [Myxococcaceae bacterium]
MLAVTSLEPRGNGPPPLTFHQGAHPPYAIRWFGVTSLFGHARHFAASAIASESVDARDWMRPTEPAELLAESLAVLGAPPGRTPAPDLVTGLGREVWIDYVADTGDDRDVSVAVAKMIFADYTNSAGRSLPRGDVLLFGGDTAYPVATAEEIEQRLLDPFNDVLADHDDGRRRVLLGIPGNHDWYDGLDGFARMFRKGARGHAQKSPEPAELAATRRAGRGRVGRSAGLVARSLHLDEVGGIIGLVRGAAGSVKAFFKGSSVRRKKRLVLAGYEPVQEATFWALPLAPGLAMWGADRQLRKVDFRQRSFFQDRRAQAPNDAVLFIAPDPAIAYGERNEPGARALAACNLSLADDRVFFLTGDMHHYERREVGRSVHVTAGGGGAFVHGTRIGLPTAMGPPTVAFPDAATSRLLVAQVPLKLMAGKAGFLVHIACAIVASIELASGNGLALGVTGVIVTLTVMALLYFVAGHHRHHARRVAALAVPFGAA